MNNSAQGTIEEPFFLRNKSSKQNLKVLLDPQNPKDFAWSGKKSIAQGTVEYLVILAVVVVISLVVVGIFTGVFSSSSQQVINSSSKLGTSSGSGVSIVDAVLDVEGDSLIKVNNTSSDPITLTKISAGGVDNDFSEQVVGMDSKTFSLSDLTSGCTCASGQKSVNCEYTIEYTQNELSKTDRINKTIDCVTNSVPVDDIKVVYPIVFGTLNYPWVISNCVELQDMNNHLDGNYILGNDINCYDDTRAGGALYNGGAGFIPIPLFSGSLNGNNHRISGIFMYTTNQVYTSLFSQTSTASILNNLLLSDFNIISNTPFSGGVGALAGRGKGSVSNIHVSSSSLSALNSNGNSIVGGLFGVFQEGSLRGCSSDVNIFTQKSLAGGVAALLFTSGVISNCYSNGIIISNGNGIGGLVGKLDGTAPGVFNCYSTADVNLLGSDVGGGLVGMMASGTIENSYSTGRVLTTSVWGNGSGGLVGRFWGGTINNSFSTGRVLDIGTGAVIGGLVGYNNAGIITNSYWDITRTGKTVCCGSGSCTDCFGKNSASSDPNAFFSNVIGLDYNVPMQHNIIGANDWTFGVDANWVRVDNNYPKLSWQ